MHVAQQGDLGDTGTEMLGLLQVILSMFQTGRTYEFGFNTLLALTAHFGSVLTAPANDLLVRSASPSSSHYDFVFAVGQLINKNAGGVSATVVENGAAMNCTTATDISVLNLSPEQTDMMAQTNAMASLKKASLVDMTLQFGTVPLHPEAERWL
jgi:hypothetical protein